jgi:anti-sigma regulatory factor (Ser/Thr protein kinase)
MGQARKYVRSRLGEILSAPKLGSAELLTTELVSNAVEHVPAVNEVGLGIDIRTGDVRVSIIDAGPGFDLPAAIEQPRETGGRGLFIVDQVSDRWGLEGNPHRVWFEIDR